MKKIGCKTRIQWGIYVAALFGLMIAALVVPETGNDLGIKGLENLENPVTALLEQTVSGNKVKIYINDKPVAVAKSLQDAKQAVNTVRLKQNKKGIVLVDAAISYEEVDRKKDKDFLKKHKTLKAEKLEEVIDKKLIACVDKERQLAYTMRIDDYTVTMDNLSDIVDILEKAQGIYDDSDAFQVKLATSKHANVANFEVEVSQKEGAKLESTAITEGDEQLVAQSSNDGVKNIGFSEEITVVATAAKKEQLTDKETAYSELAEEKGEEAVYVVQPGDYMELIAEKNDMDVAELKELNPQVESDADLYYDDRLNIMVPSSAVSVLVEKQVTYEETYYAEVQYEDDDSMYIGETSVVQAGEEGKHIVTDLVTYEGETEAGRERLEETVMVEPVAEIIRRGTKSRPTYMYPISNWRQTSGFGYRWGRLHAGLDAGTPIGTTVRASRGGRVVTAGWVGGYGYCVMIDHGDGVQTRYGHLSEVLVSVGDYVDQGQQIALSGNTGRSTGPHIHFEIRINGEPTDPTPYLLGER